MTGLLRCLVTIALVTLPCAVMLAVINLYLRGHGVTWPNGMFNWEVATLSMLDMALLLVIAMPLAAVPSFVLGRMRRERG